MSDEMTAPQYTTGSPGADGQVGEPGSDSIHTPHCPGADSQADEPSLLLLALLEKLYTDRAHGWYHELSDYYATHPELEDEFLAMALAVDRNNEGGGSVASSLLQEDNISASSPLSPGVLRA